MYCIFEWILIINFFNLVKGFFEFIDIEVFWDIFGICLREEIVKLFLIFVIDFVSFKVDILMIKSVVEKIVNEIKFLLEKYVLVIFLDLGMLLFLKVYVYFDIMYIMKNLI